MDKVKAWIDKTEKVYEVKLPSGMVVKLKRPRFSSLIKEGLLPQGLLSVAIKIAEGGIPKTMSSEEYSDVQKVMEVYVANAVIDPKITLENEEGKMPVSKIPDMDFYYITTFAMGLIKPKGEVEEVSKDLEPFREVEKRNNT